MTSDVNDVINSCCDRDVAVFVPEAGVHCVIVTLRENSNVNNQFISEKSPHVCIKYST